MKSNLNNIDEIFREGLNNFAQEPESGLWKKIAGRLLWKEIMQFNFTNIPLTWTGIAATGIIVTSLLVFNLLPTENSQEIVTENLQTLTPVISDNNVSKITQNEVADKRVLNGLTEKPKDEMNNPEVTSPTKTVQKTDPAGLTETSEMEPSGQKIENVVSGSVADSHREEDFLVENEISSSEKVSGTTLAETITTKRFSDETTTPGGSPENSVDETTATIIPPVLVAKNSENSSEIPIENPETMALITGEPALPDLPVMHELNPASTEESDIANDPSGNISNSSEIKVVGETLLSPEISTESRTHSSGKIQKMNSLSNSLTTFFKGKYKPPKRDFDEGAMELSRGKTQYFSVSGYGGYEMTDYTRTASSSREETWLGGISARYHSNKYLLESGLEFSYMHDVGDYMVDMSTYDSVGFYYGIGEFVVDPDNPDSVIFVIQKVTVYDSVQHQASYQTQCNYSYLQVPLLFGYKAFQKGRFSAFIKAGPSFSFMLNKNVPPFTYTNPEATIHSINNYSMPRLTTSIQALLSLDLYYQISKNVGILVEPTYRYYIQGVYDVDGDDLKKPYSIGVKGGVYYNFW